VLGRAITPSVVAVHSKTIALEPFREGDGAFGEVYHLQLQFMSELFQPDQPKS